MVFVIFVVFLSLFICLTFKEKNCRRGIVKVDRLFVKGKSLGKEKLIEPQNKISDLKQTNKQTNKKSLTKVGYCL